MTLSFLNVRSLHDVIKGLAVGASERAEVSSYPTLIEMRRYLLAISSMCRCRAVVTVDRQDVRAEMTSCFVLLEGP